MPIVLLRTRALLGSATAAVDVRKIIDEETVTGGPLAMITDECRTRVLTVLEHIERGRLKAAPVLAGMVTCELLAFHELIESGLRHDGRRDDGVVGGDERLQLQGIARAH